MKMKMMNAILKWKLTTLAQLTFLNPISLKLRMKRKQPTIKKKIDARVGIKHFAPNQ